MFAEPQPSPPLHLMQPPLFKIPLLLDGRWRLRKHLGAGGMGTVFEAEQVSTRRPAAVKVVEPGEEDKRITRFLREGELLGQVQHPNIVTLFDVGYDEDHNLLYIAMELIPGEDLKARQKHNPLSLDEILELAAQLLSALAETHRAGIIHRDIKPANIMLQRTSTGEAHLTLLDFGIAKCLQHNAEGAQESLTTSGHLFGTPHYMSPEQIQAQPLSARSDLYAVGLLLYQLTARTRPFQAPSAIEVIAKQIYETPLPLEEQWALEAPFCPEFAAIIHQMLNKSPERRPASARSVHKTIRAIQAARTRHAPDTDKCQPHGTPSIIVDCSADGFEETCYTSEVPEHRRPKRALADEDTKPLRRVETTGSTLTSLRGLLGRIWGRP